jgi:serine/threonine protein kinase
MISKLNRKFLNKVEIESLNEKQLEDFIVNNDLCAGSVDKFDQDYISLKKIGSGGYGTVYYCYDKIAKHHVAVKIMPLDID